MIRTLRDLPRHVAISLAVIVAAIIMFAISLPTLGGARDDAFAENMKLASEITRVNTTIKQSKADIEYVKANKDQFEALLQSDRLIPHTRRAAVVELEKLARANGLKTLNYNIGAVASNSIAAVGAQPATNGYRVSVENIDLKIGAPIDAAVFNFIVDISESFPGSAIVQTVALKRPPALSAAALNAVSKGQDGELVAGSILISWRTAQAQEKDAK